MCNPVVRFGVENSSRQEQIHEMMNSLKSKGFVVRDDRAARPPNEPNVSYKSWCDFSIYIHDVSLFASFLAPILDIVVDIKALLSDQKNESEKETKVHIQIQKNFSEQIVIIVSKESDIEAITKRLRSEL
jgi:hypothetical protein